MGKNADRSVRLCYLDESETTDDSFYTFGALMCSPAQAVNVEEEINQLGDQLHSRYPTVLPSQSEFHAVEIFHGKGHWRQIAMADRFDLFSEIVQVIKRQKPIFVTRTIDENLYRARYGTRAFPLHQQTMGYILEEVEKQMRKNYSDERALIFADEHHSANDSRANLRAARGKALKGKISVALDHIFDTAYFGPSDHSRLLQAVDVCTYFYQKGRFSAPMNNAWARSQVEHICSEVDSLLEYEYVWPKQ